MKWHKRLFRTTKEPQSWSKDRSTKVGAVIVGENRSPRANGYNGFPRGTNDDLDHRHERPLKYKWTEHAERNAIYNAAYNGISTKGCTMYVTHYPCVDCARAIIQSGITTVVVDSSSLTPYFLERWQNDVAIANEMLSEAGVTVILMDMSGEIE